MVTQYPNIILIPGIAPESTYENGEFVTGQPTAEVAQMCRYEPSTLNRAQPMEDGSVLRLKGICYMPATAPDVSTGVWVEIPGVLPKTKVLFFSRGALDCKVYL